MSPYASVVVPTHDRASTLAAAIASIQRQTVADLEIIIAGDGPTPEVRSVAQGLASSDGRVRFVDAPKASTRGGPNRDRAVHSARAERIFYTDDDDLWLPHHVATLGPALDRADIADSLMASVGTSGLLHVSLVDNSDDERRRQFAAGHGKTVFDTHLAHRRSAYLKLDTSWSDGNVGRLFAAFARSSSVRWESRGNVTALSLHGAARAGMAPEGRRAEIERWSARLDALARAGVPKEASPAWWTFRSVRRFDGPSPLPRGFSELSAEHSLAHSWSAALARRQPIPEEAARLLPFLLDRVLKPPPYPDLAECLIAALGPDAALRAVHRVPGQRDGGLEARTRFLEAHVLAAADRTTEAELLLAREPAVDPELAASQLQLRAQLRLATDPSGAAALAMDATRLMPQDRQAWRLAFDCWLSAGEVRSAEEALRQFDKLISTADRTGALQGGRHARLVARRDKLEAKLTKLRKRQAKRASGARARWRTPRRAAR